MADPVDVAKHAPEVARLEYESYSRAAGGLNAAGHQLPTWKELPSAQRQAFIEGCAAGGRRWLALLGGAAVALLLLLPLAAVAQGLPMPTFDAEVWLAQVSAAASSGHWILLAGLLLFGVVAGLRLWGAWMSESGIRWVAAVGAWLRTPRGGALSGAALAILGDLVVQLHRGGPIPLSSLWVWIVVWFTAMGANSAVKRVRATPKSARGLVSLAVLAAAVAAPGLAQAREWRPIYAGGGPPPSALSSGASSSPLDGLSLGVAVGPSLRAGSARLAISVLGVAHLWGGAGWVVSAAIGGDALAALRDGMDGVSVGGLLGVAVLPPAREGAGLRLALVLGTGYEVAPRPGWSFEFRLALLG